MSLPWSPLQRLEGLSDREATERYCFDNRWRYAAGVGGYDTTGWTSFVHTVLVDMRERLRRSERPNRIFDVAREAAKEAGLIGRKRVLDSTPLYDAVATMDTVTLIRSAIHGLAALRDYATDPELRLKHGKAARQRVLDDFQSEEVWMNTARAFATLCQSTHRPGTVPEADEPQH